MGLYNKRGAPELMDLATAQALAALVDDVYQWGGNDSSVLVAHDGVKRFTDRLLGLQRGMLRDQTPAVLVSEMPEDPSRYWYQNLWSLVSNWEMDLHQGPSHSPSGRGQRDRWLLGGSAGAIPGGGAVPPCPVFLDRRGQQGAHPLHG